jgi:hypothetical protein
LEETPHLHLSSQRNDDEWALDSDSYPSSINIILDSTELIGHKDGRIYKDGSGYLAVSFPGIEGWHQVKLSNFKEDFAKLEAQGMNQNIRRSSAEWKRILMC